MEPAAAAAHAATQRRAAPGIVDGASTGSTHHEVAAGAQVLFIGPDAARKKKRIQIASGIVIRVVHGGALVQFDGGGSWFHLGMVWKGHVMSMLIIHIKKFRHPINTPQPRSAQHGHTTHHPGSRYDNDSNPRIALMSGCPSAMHCKNASVRRRQNMLRRRSHPQILQGAFLMRFRARRVVDLRREHLSRLRPCELCLKLEVLKLTGKYATVAELKDAQASNGQLGGNLAAPLTLGLGFF